MVVQIDGPVLQQLSLPADLILGRVNGLRPPVFQLSYKILDGCHQKPRNGRRGFLIGMRRQVGDRNIDLMPDAA